MAEATGKAEQNPAQDPAQDQVTRLLRAVGQRPEAAGELLELVYEQLRALAARRLAHERKGHTLQATALVHDVFVRLVGDQPVPWQDRAHFYAAAAQAMRRILIDHARRHQAEKRGGRRRRVPISVVDLAETSDPEQVLALEEAMRSLEDSDPRAADVVRLRFYAGLSVEQTAAALGVSERTVLREWAYARAALFERLTPGEPE
jgi:RNA polymerase sigma factor (TIGR02999 family)